METEAAQDYGLREKAHLLITVKRVGIVRTGTSTSDHSRFSGHNCLRCRGSWTLWSGIQKPGAVGNLDLVSLSHLVGKEAT